jgi:benzoyl-CoA reductase/2-hydroxyglutaryl-CoA dehydratase subunit BcrC/BadD/HgdB
MMRLLSYLTHQLVELVGALTSALGVVYEPERIREALCLSNQARALALHVAALRVTDPAPLRGSSMLSQLGMLTTMFGHPTAVAYYRALRDYTRERVERSEPEQAHQKLRVYWMHLKPYFSDELLPHLEDDLGAVIAFEEASTVWWDELDLEQPLRALAGKMLAVYFNGPIERRVDLALRNIRRYQCVGAVHFSHWGCRQSMGALRNVRLGLRREGIPLLELDGDCVDPENLQLGPLRTRVDAFVEMLA